MRTLWASLRTLRTLRTSLRTLRTLRTRLTVCARWELAGAKSAWLWAKAILRLIRVETERAVLWNMLVTSTTVLWLTLVAWLVRLALWTLRALRTLRLRATRTL